MSEVLSVIVPVLFFLCLGLYCRKRAVVGDAEIAGFKTVSIRFLWPLVLFYAFFTASYGVETIFYAGVNFATNVIAFLIGMLLRRKAKEHSFSYPYLLSGFETGMIGYPLYTLLFGVENISYLALLDVGHALFIFPVFLSCLNMEQGEGKKGLRSSAREMLLSPIMLALLAGMAAGFTGLGELVMGSGAGLVIDKAYELISAANTVMILFVMGYNLTFSVVRLRESLRIIGIRLVIMTLCAIGSLWVLRQFVPMDIYLFCAVIVTYIMPPVYMLSVYVKDKPENEFMSTTTTIFTMFTILAFLVMTVLVSGMIR